MLYRGITVATGRLTFPLIVCGLDERQMSTKLPDDLGA